MGFRCFLIVLVIVTQLNAAFSFSFQPNAMLPTKSCLHSAKSRYISLPCCRSCQSLSLQLSTSSTSSPTTSQTKGPMSKVLEQATNLFPIWVFLFSVVGFWQPKLLQWFLPFVTPALTLTMIGMGMTLTIADFKRVIYSWQYVLLGFLAQYLIMPLSAYFSAKLFDLPPDIASGLILVGCAPGGTASNLVTLIAQADLALSILMTTASTVAAVFMTPFLVTKLAGGYVSVRSADLVISTLNVVLLPVLLGLFLNTNYPALCQRVSTVTPSISVLLVALICGSISASNSKIIHLINGWNLLGAIALLHSLGFGFGYLAARLLNAGEQRARTISIETGMQNSALAVVLAQHFPNPQMSSLPGAISATCHSVIGSILAAFWRWSSSRESKPRQQSKTTLHYKI
jgi:BASS family bile acid:Na+ symporter